MEKKKNSFTQKIGGVNFIVNIKAAEDASQEAEEFIKDLISKDILTEENKENWAIPIYSLLVWKNQINCHKNTWHKGELLRSVGSLLEDKGYEITVFNLHQMDKSDGYNPLNYIRKNEDIDTLATTIINNTNDKNHSAGEKFWEDSERSLLKALIAYLYSQAPKEEQNFATLMYMLEHLEAREEDENYKSPVDLLFEDLAFLSRIIMR